MKNCSVPMYSCVIWSKIKMSLPVLSKRCKCMKKNFNFSCPCKSYKCVNPNPANWCDARHSVRLMCLWMPHAWSSISNTGLKIASHSSKVRELATNLYVNFGLITLSYDKRVFLSERLDDFIFVVQ